MFCRGRGDIAASSQGQGPTGRLAWALWVAVSPGKPGLSRPRTGTSFVFSELLCSPEEKGEGGREFRLPQPKRAKREAKSPCSGPAAPGSLDRPPQEGMHPCPWGGGQASIWQHIPGQLPRMPAAGVGYAASGSERSCSWEWTLPGSRKERLCQRQAAGGTASPCGGAGVGLAHGQGLVPSSPHPPWKGGGRSPEFGRPCKNPG